MSIELEEAQIMFKLARKVKWGASYDRDEYFKRFQYLDEAIKDLQKKDWIIIHKKPKFIAFSLNPKYKMEIIEFVKRQMPELPQGWEK
ncbi:MAG: hypothetical protein AABW47_00830 [Nanoarchaeota archaeon]